MRRARGFVIAALVVLAAAFAGSTLLPGLLGPGVRLAIVSGSENAALEPIIAEWARDEGVEVAVTYLGSVDISRELGRGRASEYDAAWPANALWIELGDSAKVVKHKASIFRSPVVLGLRKPLAEKLGWVGRTDVTVEMIEAAAAEGAFRLAMTSATQSNSGASAYLGFLYALAGNPDVLTLAHLEDETLLGKVRTLLSRVDRSSGSSGWLAEKLVENPDAYDAMMNYESLVIEANAKLVAAGRDPLYVVYPANGLSVSDSPLGYVDKGDPAKEEAFLKLQAHLLSPEVQARLVSLGRRAGLLGLSPGAADRAVWDPAQGIDLARDIAPVPTPAAEVIAEALRLYQTELRKPSLTVWVLDVSGSMEGEPLAQLKTAMALVLDPERAAAQLLQPSRRDITLVIPFNHRPGAVWRVDGNDPAELRRLLGRIDALEAGGGTDIYRALDRAMEELERIEKEGRLYDHLPAIVSMTDGASDVEFRTSFLRNRDATAFGRDIPIHAISFGAADEAQLKELAGLSIGRLFKGSDDLAGALRSAKGYN